MVRATLSDRDREIAETLKDRILAQDGRHIRRIILYGSRASGTAARDSDLDLLVVKVDPVSKREEMERLRQAVRGLSVPVDVWVMGETEYEETKGVIGGLAYPAHVYGAVLYENA